MLAHLGSRHFGADHFIVLSHESSAGSCAYDNGNVYDAAYEYEAVACPVLEPTAFFEWIIHARRRGIR